MIALFINYYSRLILVKDPLCVYTRIDKIRKLYTIPGMIVSNTWLIAL